MKGDLLFSLVDGNAKTLSILAGPGILLTGRLTSFLMYRALVITAEYIRWPSSALLVLAPECMSTSHADATHTHLLEAQANKS